MRFSELDGIISSINGLANRIIDNEITLGGQELTDIQATIEEVNLALVGFPRLRFQEKYNWTSREDYTRWAQELKQLTVAWNDMNLCDSAIKTNRNFWDMYIRFKYVAPEDIITETINTFESLDTERKELFLSLNWRYTFLSASLNYKTKDYSLIRQHVNMLSEHIEDYKWFYDKLEDYRSKEILNGVISFWFDFNIEKMHCYSEYIFKDYYDLDIVKADTDTVMVDCGAYTGDSIVDYVETFKTYKNIYALEMTPSTFKQMQNNLAELSDITCINKAVGAEQKELHISDLFNVAGNNINNQGDTAIDMTTLDVEINEPISIIKMDVEGAEKDALLGAKNHIMQDKPQLLISTYHIPADIFDIPRMIDQMRDDYKFYLRFNGHGIWPCDYVLLAI